MSLPILKVTTTLTPQSLVRHWTHSESILSEALTEPRAIEGAQVFCEPALPTPRANRVLDAFAADMPAAQRLVDATRPLAGELRQWSINPTVSSDVRQHLESTLERDGLDRKPVELLVWNHPPSTVAPPRNVQIVSARTSYALTRLLFAQFPEMAAAVPAWLDESRIDGLLALEDRAAVGFVAVLSLGQVGRILHLFVAPAHRRRGIGTELLRRALELCSRSLFHHVFAAGDHPQIRSLLTHFGFVPLGTVETFERKTGS